ncbi:MAG: hypothetical protein HYX68_23230 [Planctomycetes bacterium]|jgi:hypothetical protein|nr:hypothetical protein [Planctomycetota bacterium]
MQAHHDVSAGEEQVAGGEPLRAPSGEGADIAPELPRHAHANSEERGRQAGPQHVAERAAGMKSLDQDGTNYCWANGPVNCVRVIRAVNGQPFVDLSPASVAAPFTHYRNEGGFGTDALRYIVEHGVASTEFWPANAIDPRFDTPEMRKNAAKHRVTEWYDLRPGNFDQLATCLLLGFPVAVGYNWWGHEVTALDLVETSPGVFGVRIWNSWGDSWSERGMAVLSESKGTPDDAVAPRVVHASKD